MLPMLDYTKFSPIVSKVCDRLNILPREGMFRSSLVFAVDMELLMIEELTNLEFFDLYPFLMRGLGATTVMHGDTVIFVKGLTPFHLIRGKADRSKKKEEDVKKDREGFFEGKPHLSSIFSFFLEGKYYRGRKVSEEPYSKLINVYKCHIPCEEGVYVYEVDDTPLRYYSYLKDLMGSTTSRRVLKHESYYSNVGSEYLTDSANNYQDAVRILSALSKSGTRNIYCPGDGIGVGVMAGIYLKEVGFNIEVRGSDKYLSDISPVTLDKETPYCEDWVYVYLNSYNFCGPIKREWMIVYDRQNPYQMDRENGREDTVWYRVRPFLYTNTMSFVSRIPFPVTNYERERGPMVNSVLFSLKTDSPFDNTQCKQVVILPSSNMDPNAILPVDNNKMTFFRGSYELKDRKVVLTVGGGPFTSYHYLSFPNDFVDACRYSVNRFEFPNRAAIFWSSKELLGLDSYAVRSFKREGGTAYLYYIPIDRENYFFLRYIDGDDVKTAMLYVTSTTKMQPYERYCSTEVEQFDRGLCVFFIRHELKGSNYDLLSKHDNFVPDTGLLRRCAEFCSQYCNHTQQVILTRKHTKMKRKYK